MTAVTITGNLTADPELRFTASGVPVANFTVASTPRLYDKQAQEWRDGSPLFLRCTVWREMAEHVAGSLEKGQRVVVTGELEQRAYDDKEGVKRTVTELRASEVAASLRYAMVQVRKVARLAAVPGQAPHGDAWSGAPGEATGTDGQRPF